MFRTSTVFILFLVFFYCNGQLISVISINDLLTLPKTISYNYNNYSSLVSDTCKEQLGYLEKGIREKEEWALKMVDASSTGLPSGMRKGNFYDLGQFDECYNIKQGLRKNLTIHGKYCFAIVGLSNTFMHESLISQVVRVGAYMGVPHIAICVPSGCDAHDVNLIYKKNYIAVGDRYCYSKDELPPLSKGAKITLAGLGCIAGLVVISTLYEIYLLCFRKDAFHDTLISFSMVKNFNSLTKVSFNPSNIGCLSGIKFLSTLWVLIGHEYLNSHDKPLSNQFFIENFRDKLINAYVYGGTVSVDTFFCIAGLLLVYIALKGYDNGKKFNFLLGLKHRYLRLTPVLAVVMLVTAQLGDYAGNGPIWSNFYDTTIKACERNWWKNMFYMQNILSDYDDPMCLGQSWYLSPDMHYFVVGLLLTYPLYRWPKWTVYFLYFLGVLGFAVPFGITLYYKILVTASRDYMIVYYMSSATRFGPYVIGMLTGYYLYVIQKTKFQLHVPAKWVVIFWPTVVGTMYLCIYYDYTLYKYDSQLLHSVYMGFVRNVWSIAVSAMILACHVGYGGFVNTFLSNSVFQVAARLSYALYLIHYEVQQVSSYSIKYVYEESNFNNTFMFIGNAAISIFYSLIAWFMIEAPMAVLEPYIFGPGPGKKKTKNNENPTVEIEEKCAEQLESNVSQKKRSCVPYNVNV